VVLIAICDEGCIGRYKMYIGRKRRDKSRRLTLGKRVGFLFGTPMLIEDWK
jgi:hypothetical protein